MDQSEEKGMVPKQQKGKQTDVSEELKFKSIEEAHLAYREARRRLVHVSQWHKYCGAASAEFALCSSEGDPVDREAKESDFFRINIPGPGTVSGDGDDWVQIELIEHKVDQENNTEFTSMRVRPASNPHNKKQ